VKGPVTSDSVGWVQVVVCDVTNAASLVGKMEEAVAVVTCLGAKKEFGTDGTFSSIDCQATLNIWQAIKHEPPEGNPYRGPSWVELATTIEPEQPC
jgi:hypothetical protein